MSEPLNEPLLYAYGMDESLPPMRPSPLTPEMPVMQVMQVMQVPFCELVCDQLMWAFCECGVCLCCVI